MRGRTAEAAVAAYLAARRLVAACVTNQHLRVTGYRLLADRAHTLSFVPLDTPAPLRTDDGRRLGFAVYEFYRVEGSAQSGYQVRRTAYRFHILDRLGGELLAFHWHPVGVSPVTRPHLHLPGRLPALEIEPGREAFALGGMHVPTGFLALADVVRLLIEEFRVVPRRPDWRSILDAEQDSNSG